MVSSKNSTLQGGNQELQQQLHSNLQSCAPTDFLMESVQLHCPDQLGLLQELFSRALLNGESNSALVVGGRGVGKSAVVRVALSQFTSRPDTGGSTLSISDPAAVVASGAGVLVKLHGLMQTDDRLALREITRQLRMEESTASKQFGSFAENLTFLLSSLKDGQLGQSKCVVFVLEEFDLFCHHRNQTLLYNLFDVAQSAQTPVCVVGVTCRLDAVELLEKRVRSRFSHRQIHLQPPSHEAYIAIARRLLTVQPDTPLEQRTTRQWNSSVEQLLEDDDEESLILLHSVSRDITSLQQLLRVAVGDALRCDGVPQLTAPSLSRAVDLLLADAAPSVLRGLSTLQLALVIAMKHLTVLYEGEGFTFELVYREYVKFTRRRSSLQAFERPVVCKAFDQLRCLELVTPHDSSSRTSGGVQKEYQLMRLQLPPALLNHCLPKIPNLPTDLVQWAASSLA